MLRIAREVAWLRLGSCTDHVINAAAATPDSAIRLKPASSRRRRASASRIEAGNWPTRGRTRSIAGMLGGLGDWIRDLLTETRAAAEVLSPPPWEGFGGRGYGLPRGHNPSPGS